MFSLLCKFFKLLKFCWVGFIVYFIFLLLKECGIFTIIGYVLGCILAIALWGIASFFFFYNFDSAIENKERIRFGYNAIKRKSKDRIMPTSYIALFTLEFILGLVLTLLGYISPSYRFFIAIIISIAIFALISYFILKSHYKDIYPSNISFKEVE